MHATIDTYAFVKELEEAGFNEKQAAKIVSVVKKAQDINVDNAATKRDLLELKVEMLKWMFGMLAGQLTLIVLILKFFFKGIGSI